MWRMDRNLKRRIRRRLKKMDQTLMEWLGEWYAMESQDLNSSELREELWDAWMYGAKKPSARDAWREMEQQIRDLLEECGLEEAINQVVGKVKGGQDD